MIEELDNFERIQQVLKEEYNWLEKVVDNFLINFSGSKTSYELVEIPGFSKATNSYSKLLSDNNWGLMERICILLALAPYFNPNLIKKITGRVRNKKLMQKWGKQLIVGDTPTAGLALLLTSRAIEKEPDSTIELNEENKLFKDQILSLKFVDDPSVSISLQPEKFQLVPTEEFYHLISTGKQYEPNYSSTFPAKKVTTEFGWADLLLNNEVVGQVQTMVNWVKNLDKIKTYSSLKKNIVGYSAILFGPPGTGKSMTVKILGQELNKSVYRIDLSQIVSKYVGETEKNLAKVFDWAKNRDWILFFDEGDALFGKRSSSKSSQDRYANQEVAYLLQRMEEHEGVIILATNKKDNIDSAFSRRFQTQIYFPNPDEQMRLILWKRAYSEEFKLENPKILNEIARKYQVSPAQIVNIKHHSIVRTLGAGKKEVQEEFLLEGLKLELQKINKTL